MADFAAPTPEDDQQPAPVEAKSPAPAATAPAGEVLDTPSQSVDPVPAVSEPAVAPTPAPEPPNAAPALNLEPEPPVPSFASTIEVPASTPSAADGEGGEWELLMQKLGSWLSSGQLQQQWQAARQPLSLVAGLIALLLVLRIYGALVGVLDSLPLLPGLLELVGVITVVRFSLTRLVRSDERQRLIGGLQQRWKSFLGQG